MRAEIVERLKVDYGFREQGTYLVSGRCPQCRRPDLFGRADEPWVVTCNHRNKCGFQVKTKELYPDIWENLPKKFKATPDDPHRTARMFLQTRGLDPDSFEGLWEQATWTDSKGAFEDVRLDTVLFQFAGIDKDGRPIAIKNHRIIAPPKGCDKTRTVPAYKGNVWQPPKLPVVGDLWVVEGVVEGLSLMAIGLHAVSPLSAGHVPDRWLDSLRGTTRKLIIAYNNDPAGHAGASKMGEACHARGIQYDFAFPPEEQDWNDLLLAGQFAPDNRLETLNLAAWRGQLHKTPDAAGYYAELKKHQPAQGFEWAGAYYRAAKDEGEGSSVRRISDFSLKPIYFMRKKIGGGRDEYTSKMEVLNHTRKHQVALAPKEMSDNRAFKQALYGGALAQWTGGQPDLDWLLAHLLSKRPTVVREVNVVGYDEEADAYLFPDMAYDARGKAIAPEGGFFKIDRELFALNISDSEKAYPLKPSLDMADMLAALHGALGEKGLAVAGFASASLFAQQFASRPGMGFFPFLSLYGRAGTGKSSITVLMNRWMGRNVTEGIAIAAVDTAKGSTRQIAAVSNIPLAITEMDPEKGKRFDLSRLLNLFNRSPLQTRANKTHDLSTTELKFLGTLLFSQNAEPFHGEPIRSRIVSLDFGKEPLAGAALDANRSLLSQPAGTMTAFRHGILTRREDFQAALFAQFDRYRDLLTKEGIGHARVVDTHALVAAGAHAVLRQFLAHERAERMALDLYAYMAQTAAAQVKSLGTESDYLGLWLDALRTLLADQKIHDHNRQFTEDVWVQMSEVQRAMNEYKYQFNWTQIFEELQSSPKVTFRNDARYSSLLKRTARLYGIRRDALGLPEPDAKSKAS